MNLKQKISKTKEFGGLYRGKPWEFTIYLLFTKSSFSEKLGRGSMAIMFYQTNKSDSEFKV